MLDSVDVKTGAAAHPKHPGVAVLTVIGVGFPAARVEISCGPSGIVSELVDALIEWRHNELPVNRAGQSHEQDDHPISHERTPRNNSGLRRTRGGQEFAHENLM